MRLTSYSDNQISLLGHITVYIDIEVQEARLPLIVAKGNETPLFDRNCSPSYYDVMCDV